MDIARGKRSVADTDRATDRYDGPRSSRLGSWLRSARSLDRFAPEPIRLKWPNDLYIDDRKLGGNSHRSALARTTARVGCHRNRDQRHRARRCAARRFARFGNAAHRRARGSDSLRIRSAAQLAGNLAPVELAEWDARDMARGRHCTEPARGIVEGVSPAGELLVALADSVARFRSGSLVLEQRRMILVFDVGNTETTAGAVRW